MKMSRALLALSASCMFAMSIAATGCDSMGNHNNDSDRHSSMQNSNSRNGVSGTGTGNTSSMNTQTGGGGSGPNGGLESSSPGNPNGVTRDANSGATGNR